MIEIKKTSIILFVIFISLFMTFAKNTFVTVRICPVFSDASPSSERVGLLKQGEKLSIINEKGEWLCSVCGENWENEMNDMVFGDSE